jgi:hypothetical protein
MEVLIIAVFIGLIPAAIAKGKGRSFGLWWFFGAALFIVALPASLLIKANASTIKRVNISAGMDKYPSPEERIARARARRLSKEPLSSNSLRGQGDIPLQNESPTPGDNISKNLNVLQFTGFLGALLVLLSWVGVVSYQVGWIGFAVGAASAVFLNKQ